MEKVGSVASYVPQIRQINLFSYLENSELDRILKLTEIVKYAQDEKVVTQGEVSPYLFAVLEGEVKGDLIRIRWPGNGYLYDQRARGLR